MPFSPVHKAPGTYPSLTQKYYRENKTLTKVLGSLWDEISVKREDDASNRLTTDGDVEISYRSI